MSRFYDALKEASRSGVDGSATLPGDAPSAEPRHPTAMPPIAAVVEEAEAAISAAGPSAVSAELPHASDAWPASAPRPADSSAESLLEFMESSRPGQTGPSGPSGRSIDIAMNPKAPLLANAADSAVVECYRRLRTKILQQQRTAPFRTLVLTSPGPQEGKTTTALNLGLSFAMLPSFRVLVVDGDLRRGNVAKWLGVPECAGFGDWIEGSVRLEDVVLKCSTTSAHFMVSGKSRLAPAELLNSPHLGSCFRRLGEYFDLVLVDSPPANLISDVQLLARSCDAVMLVGRAFSTSRKALEQAAQDLSTYRLIGSVLNGGTRGQSYRHYSEY